MRHSYPIALLARTSLLLLVLMGVAYALVTGQPVYWLPGLLLTAGLVAELIHYLNRGNRDLAEFLAGLRYEDYSLTFNSQQAPATIKQTRAVLNQINHSFRQLSRQKEAQHLYLQKVLSLVNTGILSFRDPQAGAEPSDAATPVPGEVRWMNESLKRMLEVPYLKTIHMLEKRDAALYKALLTLKPGENCMVRIRQQPVLLAATAFTDEHGRSLLVAFQPVREALEETEAQAYQKLLRVLTHEIMNSAAPIASLADTLQQRLREVVGTGGQVPDEVLAGVEVIRKRSEGLLHFTQTYRNLSKISAASFQVVPVWLLFEQVVTLLEPTFAQRGIDPDIVLEDPDLCLLADPTLVEQVLINLVTNALDALQHQSPPSPRLRLAAYVSEQYRVVMEVSDNGAGIPAALLEEIFVPFFTTKKTGSGIGLSLSRQIMQLHKGSIQVQSVEGAGSQFQLFFPAPSEGA
ncbi:sensor histidine kinase [Hymenobacter terrenus]|uniref:sensor histidine kinase n=1 Tax=Hymenobacter terrenus TaxID=1629124 RepID=UPI000696F2FF|nr:HAMP domain-containing sensor histidine kinase [Hymenobacter terrenus]